MHEKPFEIGRHFDVENASKRSEVFISMTAVSQLDARFPAQDEDFVSVHLLKGGDAATAQKRTDPAPLAAKPQIQAAASHNSAPVCPKCRIPTRPCVNVLTGRQRYRASRPVWACDTCARRFICCIWRCGAVYTATSRSHLKRHEGERCPNRPAPVEASPPASTSSDEDMTISSADANDVLQHGMSTQLSKLWLASGARKRKRKRRQRPNIRFNDEEEDSVDDSSAQPSDCNLSSSSDEVTVRVHWCRDVATNTQPEGALSFVGCRLREIDGRIAKVETFVPRDQLWKCIRDDDGSAFFFQREDLITAINRLPATPQKCSQRGFYSLNSASACPLQSIENLPEFGTVSELSSCSQSSDDSAAQGSLQQVSKRRQPQFTDAPEQPNSSSGQVNDTQPSSRLPVEISGIGSETPEQSGCPGGLLDNTQPCTREQSKNLSPCDDAPEVSSSPCGPLKSNHSCNQQPDKDVRPCQLPQQPSELPADNTQSCLPQPSAKMPQYSDVQCADAPEKSSSVISVLADAHPCSPHSSKKVAPCVNTPQQSSALLSQLENTQACWQPQSGNIAEHAAPTPEHSSCSPGGLRPLDNTPPGTPLPKALLLQQTGTPPNSRRSPGSSSRFDTTTLPPPSQPSCQRQQSDSPTVLSPSPLGNRGASASPALRRFADTACPPPMPALASNDVSKLPQRRSTRRRQAKQRSTLSVPQLHDRPISLETNRAPAAGRARRTRVCAAKPKDYISRYYDKMLKRGF